MNKLSRLKLRHAARVIQSGGIVAYPTEAVFGLGCDPDCQTAVKQILYLKQRSQQAGLILIAADAAQLYDWITPTAAERERLFATTQEVITWIVTANPLVPRWITGGRKTIAVRITRHPVAATLCHLAGTPLVSTSANRHGHAPARSTLAVRCKFGRQIDYILPGATGRQRQPSEIRDARTGTVLRPG